MVGQYNEVEIINLSDESKVCAKTENFTKKPSTIKIGTFIGGKVLFCGEQCSVYDKETRTWHPSARISEETLYNPSGVKLNEKNWWITYGYEQKTKMYDALLNVFYDSFRMPKKHGYYDRRSLTRINDTTVFISGENGYTNHTFFYNHMDRIFTNGPDLKFERSQAVSGMYTDENGKQFAVVAGGRAKLADGEFTVTTTTEILDLENPVEWKAGSELPYAVSHATSVQYKDGFLIIGGYNNDFERFNTIIKYDAAAKKYVTLPQKLSDGFAEPAVVLVPDDYCQDQ